LHLLGSEPEHLGVVEVAHRVGRPVVLSTIAWFDLADCWREPWPMTRRVIACGKFMARAACPRLRSWRRDLYHSVDLLLPNSHAEADQLVRYFGVSAKKIHVVPNGAEPRFATGDPRPFIEAVGLRHFVLCPGRIEPRKNQLGLIRALRGCGLPIVILGDAVPGHEKYLATCRASADQDVRFMGRIERDDPLLASAYAACRCLALVSWYETPGLVALEAAMSGAPLVLPKGGCAREYFAGHASYVAPNDEEEIRREVLRAFERGRSLSLASLVRKQFSWQAVARATKEAYEKVL
jgi:glycosyltransferase involved in cell wall biosynthesis